MAKKKKVAEVAPLQDLNDRQKALNLVQERFSVSKKFTQGYFSKFQSFYELYKSYLQKGRLPWRSNLFIPKTFEIVETVAPRIAQAQRTFKTLPVEGMDVENSDAYTDLLKFQFYKSDMEDVIEELVKETLIYGSGWVKVYWEDNQPKAEVADIFDVFPDPKARSDKELKYVIHRLERDIEDLKSNPNYDQKAIKELETLESSASDTQEQSFRNSITGVTSKDSTRKRFEVLEYHGYFNDKIYIITTVGNILLRADESPYKCIPFILVNDHKVPHELYGIGEIQPIESLQNELNDIRNQRMDNVKLRINSMWKVLPGGALFDDELVSRPGGIIHVSRPDGVESLVQQPLDASAFTEPAIINSDMERATGANTAISGALVSPMGGTQGGTLNRTATAYQGAINQGDKRFNSKINQIKRGLIKIGRKFLEFDQLFMSKPQVIRIIGEEGDNLIPVYPEDIKNQFDLEVEIEYLDDFQRMQQDISLIQVMSQIPGFDTAAYIVDILERDGRKDVKKYIKQPQPPAPEQPKVNLQLRGDMTPDAVAQILNQREGVVSNPELVGSQMRMMQNQENQNSTDLSTGLNENSYGGE